MALPAMLRYEASPFCPFFSSWCLHHCCRLTWLLLIHVPLQTRACIFRVSKLLPQILITLDGKAPIVIFMYIGHQKCIGNCCDIITYFNMPPINLTTCTMEEFQLCRIKTLDVATIFSPIEFLSCYIILNSIGLVMKVEKKVYSCLDRNS